MNLFSLYCFASFLSLSLIAQQKGPAQQKAVPSPAGKQVANVDPDLVLLKAASAGDMAAARRAISQKADPNYQHGEDKITPLMIALMRGRVEMVNFLLDSGAHPNVADKDGYTAANYLSLTPQAFPKDQQDAMLEAIKAKGAQMKNTDGLSLVLWIGSKPLAPSCFGFETAPCGVQTTPQAPPSGKPAAATKPTAKVTSGPHLNGVWKLNLAQSEYGSFPKPEAVTHTISHNDGEIVFQTRQVEKGNATEIKLRYTLGGKPTTNDLLGMAVKTTAKWDGPTLVLRSEANAINRGNLIKEDNYTLSPDGKTLTNVMKILSGQGGTTTTVFERQ
jgi:hypothetical protein